MKAPTIKDVAEAAGVSFSTVSLALRDDPRIAKATKAKVLEAAATLKYQRNPVFAALGSRRPGHAGHQVNIAYFDVPLFRHDVWRGVEMRGNALGYSVYRFEAGEFGSWAKAADVLYARGFAGVIFGHLPGAAEVLKKDAASFKKLACVFTNSHDISLRHFQLHHDVFAETLLLWDHLAAHGYGRIGPAICRMAPNHDDDTKRRMAILARQEALPKQCRIPPFLGGVEDQVGFHEWVAKYRPDAVMGFHSGMAYWLRDAGWRIPQELGFASLHTTDDEVPICSGVLMEDFETGRAAVELADQALRHGDLGQLRRARILVLPSGLLEGTTLSKQRSGKSHGITNPPGKRAVRP